MWIEIAEKFGVSVVLFCIMGLFIKQMLDNHRQDIRYIMDSHQKERSEWRAVMVRQHTESLIVYREVNRTLKEVIQNCAGFNGGKECRET